MRAHDNQIALDAFGHFKDLEERLAFAQMILHFQAWLRSLEILESIEGFYLGLFGPNDHYSFPVKAGQWGNIDNVQAGLVVAGQSACELKSGFRILRKIDRAKD